MRCQFVLLVLIACQTLADAARKEAERRKALDEQGIDVKVIERAGTSSGFPVEPRSRPGKPSAPKSSDRYRTSFQKLNREIREVEDRLGLLRLQLERERSYTRRRTTRTAAATEEKMLREIDALTVRLKRLQIERREAYTAASKAGMLPGEIDGKGITP